MKLHDSQDVTREAMTLESSTGLPPHVAAPLAYAGWWITGLLFWFVERRDPYARFHAAQSVAAFGIVALLIAAFGLMAALSLSFLPNAFTPFVWAAAVTWAFGLVLSVVSMWKTASGDRWRIPLVASLADWLVGRG